MTRAITVLLVGLALLASSVALAYPVRVGRYTEIPYGIRPDHPYPTAGGGPRRAGRLRGRVPARPPTRVFEVGLHHRALQGPIVAADGTLYVGSMGGLSAIAPDGRELWTAPLGPVRAPPSLAPSDDVVVATAGGQLLLVSPLGVTVHQADLGAPPRGSPLVLDDGSVIIGTIDQRVLRFDANLRRVFVTELADVTTGTVSLAPRGRLAVASGHLLTLLGPTGTLHRQVSLGGRASSPAAVGDDGTIWVVTVEGVLFAIDPSGRVRSRTDLGSRHYDHAALAIGHDGAVRVPTVSAGLVCVGPGGTIRWTVPSPVHIIAPAAIDEDDTTLFVARDRMIAIDRDGAERWRVHLDAYGIYQRPVLAADGTLYLATAHGVVQAWR